MEQMTKFVKIFIVQFALFTALFGCISTWAVFDVEFTSPIRTAFGIAVVFLTIVSIISFITIARIFNKKSNQKSPPSSDRSKGGYGLF